MEGDCLEIKKEFPDDNVGMLESVVDHYDGTATYTGQPSGMISWTLINFCSAFPNFLSKGSPKLKVNHWYRYVWTYELNLGTKQQVWNNWTPFFFIKVRNKWHDSTLINSYTFLPIKT